MSNFDSSGCGHCAPIGVFFIQNSLHVLSSFVFKTADQVTSGTGSRYEGSSESYGHKAGPGTGDLGLQEAPWIGREPVWNYFS